MNDQEVRDYLDRMAAGDPYGEVDGGLLLGRGRRIRRRRRRLAIGGAAVTVLAVLGAGLTVSSVLGSDRTPVAPATTPMPTPGLITDQQAASRCLELARQNPATVRDALITRAPKRLDPLPSKPGWRIVLVGYDKEDMGYFCELRTTPRPSRTPPAVHPAMFAAPNASDSAVLRACSASLARLRKGVPEDEFWNTTLKPLTADLTGWRVVARGSMARVGTVFVALSPRGDLAAHCEVHPPGSRWDAGLDSRVFRTTSGPPRTLSEHLLVSGGQCGSRCTGWMVREAGRVPVRVTRLHVKANHGGSIDVPVHDGWYALVWATGDPQKRPDLTVTAYDKNGNVVRPG